MLVVVRWKIMSKRAQIMLVDESVKGLWFLDDPYIQWHTKLTHDGNGVYLTIQWKLSVPFACIKSSPLVP